MTCAQPHKSELLDLLARFGLIVPVPRKADTWIVPALLKETSRPEAPLGWPARPAAAARLLLRFSLDRDTSGGARMWRKLKAGGGATERDTGLGHLVLTSADAFVANGSNPARPSRRGEDSSRAQLNSTQLNSTQLKEAHTHRTRAGLARHAA